MSRYNITILNCNSIDRADIVLNKGALNIKYGPNGIGKSTISKAISSQIDPDSDLSALIPFKSRGNLMAAAPEVSGTEGLSKALIFDDAYVQQFVFHKDEVIKNSFEIFIKTPQYLVEMQEIDKLLSGIRKAFQDNHQIESTIKDLIELRDAFGKSKTGAIPKTSKIHKAFLTGNKLENIPESLQPYTPFIKSAEPSKWIAWQVKGNEFLSLGDNCPYCSADLSSPGQKETARLIEQEYDATTAGHISALQQVIDRLGKYFSDSAKDSLLKITTAKVELQPEENAFLTGLKAHTEALINKLEGLRSLSFFTLRDHSEVADLLIPLKIDLDPIDTLKSPETRLTVDPVNEQLDELISKASNLKGMINKNKSKIAKTIQENQDSINSFLKSAGYRYIVEIVAESSSYKMKLSHKDQPAHIEVASRHLSYGERNAFALVLFMYQVLSENPDLVILDDPISSFDKNKKFAIMHELFHGKASLKGRTTLMLTHDIEPAIDVIKSTTSVFEGVKPTACFLSSRAGVVREVLIEKSDLQTFAKICKVNIASLADNIIRSIYLRRHFELIDDAGMEYNLLASLFKGRTVPTVHYQGQVRDMTEEEKENAQVTVREHISDFNYDALVAEVKDKNAIRDKFRATNVGYEKIQLFRIINDDHDNSVIRKFINESYHIENEYVMQLNPHRFEFIPEYIVEECASVLLGLN